MLSGVKRRSFGAMMLLSGGEKEILTARAICMPVTLSRHISEANIWAIFWGCMGRLFTFNKYMKI